MSTKYVLQPDGSILKIEESPSVTVTTPVINEGITNISKDIVEESFGESYRKSNFTDIERVDLDSGEDTLKDNLINYVSSNKSFDFINQGEERELNIPTFKNFRSFSDINNNTRMFANELELIGAHLSIGEPRTLVSIRYLFFLDYILEIAGLITAIELVTSIAETSKDNDIVESSLLSLGDYTFSTPDFISPYFLKVLNYPTKNSNTNDRLASFFLGLNLYLGGDESIKELSSLLGLEETIKTGLRMGALRVITATLLYTVEGLLQTGAKDNLLDLLIRKFQMQKYWHEEQLYKAKGEGSTEKLMAEFKYYYFKFAIERIHVGLKALNYKYFGLTYDVTRESPLNRVGLSKAKKLNNIDFVWDESWDYKYYWQASQTGNSNSQSIRNRVLPQALQLPTSFLANKILNKSIEELTNGTSIIDIDYSLEQNFVINKTNRIDKSIVKEVENILEAEYVPFYFHDIRTNEIMAFHAFIDNLTDSFTPNYQETTGFGRIDKVRNYVDTTRNIQLSFMMASTSPQDHDLMWYQVNKLVAMCYPQWSDAFVTSDNLGKYPFTQMPTASPLIRLRVGDIIKSNYSKQNLSRLHGIGDRKIDEGLKDVILNNDGKPLGEALQDIVKKTNEQIEKAVSDLENQNNQNEIGIKNLEKTIGKLKKQKNTSNIETIEEQNIAISKTNEEIQKNIDSINLLKSLKKTKFKEEIKYYLMPGLYKTEKSLGGDNEILGAVTSFLGISDKSYLNLQKESEVRFKEEKDNFLKVEYKNNGQNYFLYADKSKIRKETAVFTISGKKEIEENLTSLLSISQEIGLPSLASGISSIQKSLNKPAPNPGKIPKNLSENIIKATNEDNSINNPFTAAFESAQGKGLAGFITSLNIGGIMDSPWETSRMGSKAPMMVKIDIGFAPTHDIPPGLDHDGMMRAPTYNVGRLMNELFDDVYDE